MTMVSKLRGPTRMIVAVCIWIVLPSFVYAQLSQASMVQSALENGHTYERITAHLRGVYGPRGYFNMVVGLRSYPLAGLYGAQFNVKPGLMVLDIAPGFPRVTVAQMHHIETISGYSPGLVEIQEIKPSDFSETGPGWRKIQPPESRSAVVRWIKQNFVNHHY
jgi:hypothetical protein